MLTSTINNDDDIDALRWTFDLKVPLFFTINKKNGAIKGKKPSKIKLEVGMAVPVVEKR